MPANSSSSVIDRMVSSYFELPARIHWRKATGVPLPDHYEQARLELSGLATAWMELKQVVWLADSVRFAAGLPATVQVQGPRVQIAIGKTELDRWLKRFDLPYRLELTDDALVVHTEIAGFPLAELEARLEIVNGWFVLQPKRASVLGVPSYVATLFRTYLPLPPLSGNIQLDAIDHEPDLLRLTFRLEDFEEQITPGLLGRLQKRLIPTLELPFLKPQG
jgi:hypothetical protein